MFFRNRTQFSEGWNSQLLRKFPRCLRVAWKTLKEPQWIHRDGSSTTWAPAFASFAWSFWCVIDQFCPSPALVHSAPCSLHHSCSIGPHKQCSISDTPASLLPGHAWPPPQAHFSLPIPACISSKLIIFLKKSSFQMI